MAVLVLQLLCKCPISGPLGAPLHEREDALSKGFCIGLTLSRRDTDTIRGSVWNCGPCHGRAGRRDSASITLEETLCRAL